MPYNYITYNRIYIIEYIYIYIYIHIYNIYIYIYICSHRLQGSRAQKEQLEKRICLDTQPVNDNFEFSNLREKMDPLRKKTRTIECTIQNLHYIWIVHSTPLDLLHMRYKIHVCDLLYFNANIYIYIYIHV